MKIVVATKNQGKLKEIKDRWNSRSPKLFRKLMRFAITLGTSAVAVIASDKMFDL